jgi:hypothetical protein
MVSAARSTVTFWGVSIAVLAPVLRGDVCNAVSDDVGGSAAGSEAEASVDL